MSTVLNMRQPGVFARWQRGEVVYIGREQPYNGIVIPASPLRNGNLLKGQARGTTIEKFTRDLKDLIRAGDREVIGELLRIYREDRDVVCWCKPLACHGDVVLRAARWLATDAGAAKYRGLVEGKEVFCEE
jgi:hypothetical protein